MEALLGSKSLPPGIRFYPTDEELFMYYLKRKVLGKSLRPEMISEVDVYQFAPWELPAKSCLKTKDLYWWFICPRSKKYPQGGRSNRATVHGYWKSTGNDRTINYKDRPIGKIKTLIFHRGKPPKGDRTDWVMHEYRLEDRVLMEQGVAQDSYVICKIYEKSGLGPRNGSVLTTIDGQIVSTPSIGQQPEASGGMLLPSEAATQSTNQQPEVCGDLPLPPVETEEAEFDRLLAMFTDVDANQGPETDIFEGLPDLTGGSPPSDAAFDWSQFLSDGCYMELNDLE